MAIKTFKQRTLATAMLATTWSCLLAIPAHAANDDTAGAAPISFADIDSNKDGYIDADEAKASPALAKAFSDVDSDKDGKISPNELNAVTGASK